MIENKKSPAYIIASLISAAGHPLLTFSAFILFTTFTLFDTGKAVTTSFLVIAGVALPVAVSNYIKTKRGQYTNFDVSDREERKKFYPFLIGLLMVVCALLFLTSQPVSMCYGSAVFLAMIIASYIINQKIKCSLHTSTSLFLGLSLLLLTSTGGLLMLLFAVLISISRLVLKRHTLAEVLAGAATGLLFGVINYRVQTMLMS